MSADSLKVENLVESVRYDSGHIYFTIPESEEPWSIFIQGRLLLEDGSGMSVHYLEEESEKAEWVPQMTYSFEVADVAYDELTMDVRYGNADYCYPLTLLLPEKAPLPVEPLPEGKADIPEGAEMIWPVESDQINNSFGDRAKPGGEGVVTHTGVDIGGMEKGTPVYAAGKGTVKEAGFNPQDGNFVRIDHGNGQETFYAHCEKLLVKTGDTVTLGQTIATVGSTGQSTGPHLHFEFRVNGVSQNPEAMLKSGQDTAKPEEKPEAEPEAPKVPEEELSKMAADPQEKEPHGLTLQKEQLVDGGYPTNRQGETYGNAFGSSLIGQDPDLIAAKGTNGESGYISTEDQNITVGKTPEEIMAYMNWKEENQVTGYIIPLYDQEHNVIGEFQVGEGGSGSKTFEEMKEAKAQGWPNSKGSTLEKEEPIFKDIDEARAAAEAGWVGDSNGGYYIPVGE